MGPCSPTLPSTAHPSARAIDASAASPFSVHEHRRRGSEPEGRLAGSGPQDVVAAVCVRLAPAGDGPPRHGRRHRVRLHPYGVTFSIRELDFGRGIWFSPLADPWHRYFRFLGDPSFWQVMRNTVVIATAKLIFGFP